MNKKGNGKRVLAVGDAKGKFKVILDRLDLIILDLIHSNQNKKKKLTITELREKVGITHANLITHMRRLKPYIDREKVKQSVFLSLTEKGNALKELLLEASEFDLDSKDATITKEKVVIETIN